MIFNIRPTRQLLSERGLGQGDRVQKFIDSECIRRMDPLTPKRTGTLIRTASPPYGTIIGSGKIKQTAPYSRHNYYYNGGHGMQGTASGGLRGRLWFKRMKSLHLRAILDGARRLAGARRR